MHDPADNRATLSANSLEFIPLSSEFISTETTSTSVQVFVNDLKASCGKGVNCAYTTNSALTPKIASASLSGNDLTITIT